MIKYSTIGKSIMHFKHKAIIYEFDDSGRWCFLIDSSALNFPLRSFFCIAGIQLFCSSKSRWFSFRMNDHIQEWSWVNSWSLHDGIITEADGTEHHLLECFISMSIIIFSLYHDDLTLVWMFDTGYLTTLSSFLSSLFKNLLKSMPPIAPIPTPINAVKMLEELFLSYFFRDISIKNIRKK